MTSSKLLIDNNFVTIVLDIYVLYTELLSFPSSSDFEFWLTAKKWRHWSLDIKDLPKKAYLGFWNFLVVWLSFKKEIKG